MFEVLFITIGLCIFTGCGWYGDTEYMVVYMSEERE